MQPDSTTILDRPLISMRSLSAVAAALWDRGCRLSTVDAALASLQATGCLADAGLDVETEAAAEAAFVEAQDPVPFDDPRWGSTEDIEDDDILIGRADDEWADRCEALEIASEAPDGAEVARKMLAGRLAPIMGGSPDAGEWDDTIEFPPVVQTEPYHPTADDDLAAALAFPRLKTGADVRQDRADVAEFYRDHRGA